jgi:hypothetical protein
MLSRIEQNELGWPPQHPNCELEVTIDIKLITLWDKFRTGGSCRLSSSFRKYGVVGMKS